MFCGATCLEFSMLMISRSLQGKDLGSGSQAKPKKESILDLSKYIDKAIRVKFSGGREGKISWVFLRPVFKLIVL